MSIEEPEVQILANGEVIHRQPLGAAPVRLGRAPTNDIALTHDTVSWHHLAVWIESGNIWVRDLDSRNGTWTGEDRLAGAQIVRDGDQLRLGTEVMVRISGSPPDGSVVTLMLEDVDAGVRVAIMGDRVRIGSGEDADLRVDDGPDRIATLLVSADGITVGTDVGEFPMAIGRVFEIAGRRLRIVEATPGRTPTSQSAIPDEPEYELTVGLGGVNGAFARLSGPGDLRYAVDSDNRAVLLYLLGKQAAEDKAGDVAEPDRGWCSDSDLYTGIWGRSARDPNYLHVLVYRVRKQLKKQGFDPWFIEKRRHALRIKLNKVTYEQQ